MNKILILTLSLLLIGSAALAAEQKMGQSSADQGVSQQAGDGVQTQTIQRVQNQGEDQQIQTREEAQVQTEEGQNDLLISENAPKARTAQEARQMIQARSEVLGQEVQNLSGEEQKVYQNQNMVREAVHAFLAMEDLVGGIGSRVSEIAREFNNSVQNTIKAEEKIQTRSAFAKFFMGGDKNAAGELEQELNQNQLRIQELKQLQENCNCATEVKTIVQEQIQNLEQEQTRLQTVAEKEKNNNGIFGWVRSIFGR